MKVVLSSLVILFGTSVFAQNCLKFSEMPPDFAQAFHDNFDKHVEIFGAHLVATPGVSDAGALHAAGILAQWLDNDEDGIADNPTIVGEMASVDATIVMFDYPDSNEFEAFIVDLESELPDPWSLALQDLYDEETHPGGSSQSDGFDASLEECLHLVTHFGYASAYPTEFGEQIGSTLADAMDIARGGQFESIPNNYPEEAWYHYDDQTCDYGCMATEYIYWGLTSLLGGQNYPGRCNEIDNEWELCEPVEFAATDVALQALITNSQYNMPTILPDGMYCVATDINEIERALNVWPNPVKDMLYVDVPIQISEVIVIDSLGRIAYNVGVAGAETIQINVAGWPNGLYTVRAGNSVQVITKH